MFKPPIQSNMKGGQLQSLNAPCATAIRIEASPTWYQNNAVENLQQIADSIIFAHYNDLSQFVFASRQMCFIGGLNGQHTARNWGDLRADFSYNFGVEALQITVLPDNTPQPTGPTTTQSGNTFDVKWSFTAFPYPGMSQTGGSLVPPLLQYTGVQYVYDPGFSPSAPGPASATDTTTGIISCAHPVLTPDLNQVNTLSLSTPWPPVSPEALLANQMVGTRVIPTIDQSAVPFTEQTTGYPEEYWSKGVGGSAILTAPLSGLQYWEVKIVKLPRGQVPDSFNVPLPIVSITGVTGVVVTGTEWNGNLEDAPNVSSGAQGSDWIWPTALDTFWTPAIGVCPGYFLPDDQLPGSATAKPGRFNDYGRVLGLDQAMDTTAGKLYDRARSIYVVATSADTGDWTTRGYMQGHWTFTYYDTSQPVVQLITDSFITNPPPGGDPWPNPIVSAGRVANSSCIYSYGVQDIDTQLAQISGQLLPVHSRVDVDTRASDGYAPEPIVTTFTYGASVGPVAQSANAPASGPPPGMTGTAEGLASTTETTAPGPDILVPFDSDVGGPQLFASTITTTTLTIPWSSTPPAALFAWNDQTWKVDAVDGTTLGTSGQTGSGVYHHVAAGYVAPVTTSVTLGELLQIDTRINTTPSSSEVLDASWTPLYSAGYHTPAFIGRIDCTYDFGTYEGDGSDATKFKLQRPTTGPYEAATLGCYTGVDIGPLSNGDTVMIATDAAKGYIWFGKNGSWYGQNGQVLDPTQDGPAHGTKWAAIMDGATKSAFPITTPTGPWDRATAQPQYFPCVSYRLGPGEVKIIYDAPSLKYAPPSGFKVYGQAATV